MQFKDLWVVCEKKGQMLNVNYIQYAIPFPFLRYSRDKYIILFLKFGTEILLMGAFYEDRMT